MLILEVLSLAWMDSARTNVTPYLYGLHMNSDQGGFRLAIKSISFPIISGNSLFNIEELTCWQQNPALAF